MAELCLTCPECCGSNIRSLPYSMIEPDKCDHCPYYFRTRFSVAVQKAEIEIKLFRQSKLGSFTEAVVNTAVGYLIALVCMRFIMWAYDFPMGTRETSIVVAWMTLVSVIRGYVIRRLWNGQFWKRGRNGSQSTN